MCSVIAARNASGVAERHRDEAGRERAEAVARVGVGGEADDRRRAAVEVVVAHDDLRAVAGDALDAA